MMRVRYATQAAPGAEANQDHVTHAGGLVAVFDGVSVPEGMETGCVHGTPWYVTHLAAHLTRTAATAPGTDLREVLAAAITATRADHAGRCDLTHPGTPAAAVGIVRDQGDTLDYLVLCDVTILLDHGDQVDVVTDDRFTAAVADLRAATSAAAPVLGTAAQAVHLREITRLRLQRVNRPDGYWIAAADPTAATHAITGHATLRGAGRVQRAGMLTDGAADAVTRYHLHTWQSLLDLLTTAGPDALIGQVRTAEHADHTGHHQPRYKRHDDATAALCQFDPEQQP